MTEYRTLSDLVAAYADHHTNALKAAADDDGSAFSPEFRAGAAQGWLMAWNGASQLLPKTSAGPRDELTSLITYLRRAVETVNGRDVPPVAEVNRRGKVAALSNAIMFAQSALSYAVAAEGAVTAAPSRWDAYPRDGMAGDTIVDDIGVLAAFLGGDSTSFTGKLLTLVYSADPVNLNKLAQVFPEIVHAWLMWRATAPVPAGTLIELLKSADSTGNRELPT